MPTQKRKTDVYTLMLWVSFICLATAAILLYWELTLWGDKPWYDTSSATPRVSQSTASVAPMRWML